MCTCAASIFLIEGLGQQNYGNLNWGNGIIIDETVIQQKGLSDPNPFFQTLLSKPYRRQVIAAVHVYGPTVSGVRVQSLLSPAKPCRLRCPIQAERTTHLCRRSRRTRRPVDCTQC